LYFYIVLYIFYINPPFSKNKTTKQQNNKTTKNKNKNKKQKNKNRELNKKIKK
jgi:hypothetical protein